MDFCIYVPIRGVEGDEGEVVYDVIQWIDYVKCSSLCRDHCHYCPSVQDKYRDYSEVFEQAEIFYPDYLKPRPQPAGPFIYPTQFLVSTKYM